MGAIPTYGYFDERAWLEDQQRRHAKANATFDEKCNVIVLDAHRKLDDIIKMRERPAPTSQASQPTGIPGSIFSTIFGDWR
jgi:hypothetical protein